MDGYLDTGSHISIPTPIPIYDLEEGSGEWKHTVLTCCYLFKSAWMRMHRFRVFVDYPLLEKILRSRLDQ